MVAKRRTRMVNRATGANAVVRRGPCRLWPRGHGPAIVVFLIAVRPVVAVVVEAVRIDGTMLAGDWAGVAGDTSVELRTSEGSRSIPLDDLAELRFGQVRTVAHGDVWIRLADGGHLRGELVGPASDAVVVRSTWDEVLLLPFDRLAGIRLATDKSCGRAAELFDEALGSRMPGEDVLIACGVDEAKSLRGRLERLGGEGGSFVFDGRVRPFSADKVFGVVFAAGVGDVPKHPATVTLADGTKFSGRVLTGEPDILRISASFGTEVALSPASIANLQLRSERVVYVSDLTPVSEHIEGRLHRPWPIRRDRSVCGGTLTLGGKVFEKGLGVHSRTELAYDLAGAYTTFAATIGIDDAVRPRGSVVFRVLGDGIVLFDSEVLHGYEQPRELTADVTGIQRLTLVVDYGGESDLADHADWGAARLIRPAPRKDETINRAGARGREGSTQIR